MAKIATQLLRGSKALNRTQAEIGEIINMISGQLDAERLVFRDIEQGFADDGKLHFTVAPNAQWKISRAPEHISSSRTLYFELEIWPWEGHRRLFHNKELRNVAPRYMKFVRSSVKDLVEALGERYPVLKERWQPFIAAAAE